MIKLDNFRGSPEELSEFVTSVWSEDYAGKMVFPLWSADYFRWQFDWEGQLDRGNLIAAYDGDELVATLLGIDQNFLLGEREVSGSLWSWMSIRKDYRGQGLARLLDGERVRRLRERETDLIVSYRYLASRHSLAEKPRSRDAVKKFHGKRGAWFRILDPRGMGEWSLNRFEGTLARLSFPLTPVPRIKHFNEQIELITEEHLPECVDLLRRKSSRYPLSIHWNESQLRNQLLGNRIATTFVFRDNGRVRGLINYHLIEYEGRTTARIAHLDVIATEELKAREARELMYAALSEMVRQNAILAVKLNLGDVSSGLMYRTRFLTRPNETYLVLQWLNSHESISRTEKLHLLWR